MKSSDRWELQASEALDGEIGSRELIELLDAMADEPECRRFWREARQLQSLVDGLESAPGRRSPAPRRRRRWAVAAIAAALLAAIGLSFVFGPGAPTPAGAEYDVVLEENAGRMSDERFVDLTLELLRSDRRYQRRMLQILDQVGVADVVEEGSHAVARGEREYRLTQHRPDDRPESQTGAGEKHHVY